MNDNGELTVSARIAAIILKGAARLGVPEGRLAGACGFDLRLLENPDARLPIEQESALWTRAAELAGDGVFGLHVAEMIQPGMFDVLDYVVRTAPSLRGALDRLVRYNRLMHDVAEFVSQDLADSVLIHHRFRTSSVWPNRHAVEFTLASLVVIGRQMTAGHPVVKAVNFTHPAAGDGAAYLRVFGVAPGFSATGNTLKLAAESLQAPVLAADPALSRIVTSHADQLLSRLGASAAEGLLARVRRGILAGMAEGEASVGAVARQLGMSERSLQRALRAEGTTFNELFSEVRKQTALDFIADSKIALGEIAYLLGFSEPSAFHRAFKRWTGLTPLAARQARRTTRG